jgi:ABC-type transport system substrate-binding protein
MNKKRLMLFSFLVLLLLSACTGAEPAEPTTTTNQAPTTTPAGSQISAEPAAPPELDPSLTGDDLLVAIEARWMCDVQRFAFSDLGVLNEALDERLAASGLSRTEYDVFKAQLETRIELREQVLAEYDAYCGED